MKFLYFIIFLILYTHNFSKEKSDSIKIIRPFVKAEIGFGASNVMFKEKNDFKYRFNNNYSFNLISGFKYKDFYFGAGIGMLTFGYRLNDVILLNPSDPINGELDKAIFFDNKLYINIPIEFTYKKILKSRIFPIVGFGLNNLILTGKYFGYKGSEFSEYPKREFINYKENIKEKRYIPSMSLNFGFGIKIKSHFTYEFGLVYNQTLIKTNYGIDRFGNLTNGLPYAIGIKCGINYNF